MRVIASLATIPPRITNGDLRRCIDSLLQQSYIIDKVYVTIPYNYKRFGRFEDSSLPSWLAEGDYASRVVVVRPQNDIGSILKYMGLAYVMDESEIDNYVFVCDDDQVYHQELVKKMIGSRSSADAVLQNRYDTVRFGSGGIVHGFVGLLVPAKALSFLPKFPIPACGFVVDDQIMSIFFTYHNIPMLSSGVNELSEIYAVLENGRERAADAPGSLHHLGGREVAVKDVLQFYQARMVHGGEVILDRAYMDGQLFDKNN